MSLMLRSAWGRVLALVFLASFSTTHGQDARQLFQPMPKLSLTRSNGATQGIERRVIDALRSHEWGSVRGEVQEQGGHDVQEEEMLRQRVSALLHPKSMGTAVKMQRAHMTNMIQSLISPNATSTIPPSTGSPLADFMVA